MLDVIGDLRPRLSKLVNDTFVAVILFGSLARCEADSRSGVDILVFHKNLGRIDRVRRRRAVYLAVSALPRDYPLTVIDVDVDEFLNPGVVTPLLFNIYWDAVV